MAGTLKRADHQKLVEKRLQAYAAQLVRRVMARQQGGGITNAPVIRPSIPKPRRRG